MNWIELKYRTRSNFRLNSRLKVCDVCIFPGHKLKIFFSKTLIMCTYWFSLKQTNQQKTKHDIFNRGRVSHSVFFNSTHFLSLYLCCVLHPYGWMKTEFRYNNMTTALFDKYVLHEWHETNHWRSVRQLWRSAKSMWR